MALELFNLRCVDGDLGQLCADQCNNNLDICTANCAGSSSCTSRCQGDWLDCLTICPCYSGCPEGCQGCPNPICGESGQQHLFVIDERMGDYNKGMHWNSETEEIQFRNFNYNYSYQYDMGTEDSCYAMMNGEHYLLGGYYNKNAVAKIEDCAVKRQDVTLTYEFVGGTFGSCAEYQGKIMTCFDGKAKTSKECQIFDGVHHTRIEHLTARGHDWADLVLHEGSLVTVGGCDNDGSYEEKECHGVMEVFDDDEGWSLTGTDFEFFERITNHALFSEPSGLILITDSSDDNMVFRLRNNIWSELGNLQKSAFYLAKTQFLGDIFIGYDFLERITITDEGMTSVVYDSGFKLHMDYSPMFPVDADYCMDA